MLRANRRCSPSIMASCCPVIQYSPIFDGTIFAGLSFMAAALSFLPVQLCVWLEMTAYFRRFHTPAEKSRVVPGLGELRKAEKQQQNKEQFCRNFLLFLRHKSQPSDGDPNANASTRPSGWFCAPGTGRLRWRQQQPFQLSSSGIVPCFPRLCYVQRGRRTADGTDCDSGEFERIEQSPGGVILLVGATTFACRLRTWDDGGAQAHLSNP